MADLSGLLENLSPDANIRGRQFERICQWHLLHDPGYRAQIKKVWLWADWPGRWGPDAGIDLVAETHESVYKAPIRAIKMEIPVISREVST